MVNLVVGLRLADPFGIGCTYVDSGVFDLGRIASMRPYVVGKPLQLFTVISLENSSSTGNGIEPGKIGALSCLDTNYTADPNIELMLDEEHSIWLNEKKTEVVFTVAPAAESSLLSTPSRKNLKTEG